MNSIDTLIGKSIRDLRIAKGLSQDELGHLVGVSDVVINNYENGESRVGAAQVLKIAQALGTQIGDIFEKIELNQRKALVELGENHSEIKSRLRDLIALSDRKPEREELERLLSMLSNTDRPY